MKEELKQKWLQLPVFMWQGPIGQCTAKLDSHDRADRTELPASRAGSMLYRSQEQHLHQLNDASANAYYELELLPLVGRRVTGYPIILTGTQRHKLACHWNQGQEADWWCSGTASLRHTEFAYTQTKYDTVRNKKRECELKSCTIATPTQALGSLVPEQFVGNQRVLPYNMLSTIQLPESWSPAYPDISAAVDGIMGLSGMSMMAAFPANAQHLLKMEFSGTALHVRTW